MVREIDEDVAVHILKSRCGARKRIPLEHVPDQFRKGPQQTWGPLANLGELDRRRRDLQ